MKKLGIASLLLIILFLVGCEPVQQQKQVANPATLFCIEKGFDSQIKTADDGSQSGICNVKMGNETAIECDEWEFFRGECPICSDYCKAQPHVECVGQANVSGKYPDCSCGFICEVKEEVKAAEPKVPEKFLIHFPWTKGELWRLSTNFHDGNALDFIREEGAGRVLAAADGTVLMSNYGYPNDFNTYGPVKTGNLEDMGNYVFIQHSPNTYTIYLHLQHADIAPVKSGDAVKAGTFLGWMGNTGFSHGEHLHFAVVDVSIFPTLRFVEKPIESWGFEEYGGLNALKVNMDYASQNVLYK